MRILLSWFALALVAVSLAASPATARQRVDLALILAVDVSGSIDDSRFDLQREGFADAFANQGVIDAIASGDNRAIVVTLVEWSGPDNQSQIIGWTLIDSPAAARAFGESLRNVPRVFNDFTSISAAMNYCVAIFADSGFDNMRMVIDVSGDGSNNTGPPIAGARDAAIEAGITINGLPILATEPDLEPYYRDNVIGGPGSFLIPAQDFRSFSNAILNKLVREIAGRETPRSQFAALTEPRQR